MRIDGETYLCISLNTDNYRLPTDEKCIIWKQKFIPFLKLAMAEN